MVGAIQQNAQGEPALLHRVTDGAKYDAHRRDFLRVAYVTTPIRCRCPKAFAMDSSILLSLAPPYHAFHTPRVLHGIARCVRPTTALNAEGCSDKQPHACRARPNSTLTATHKQGVVLSCHLALTSTTASMLDICCTVTLSVLCSRADLFFVGTLACMKPYGLVHQYASSHVDAVTAESLCGRDPYLCEELMSEGGAHAHPN